MAIALKVGSTVLDAALVRGVSGVSRLFRFHAQATSIEEPPPLDEIVGKPFELALDDAFGRSLVIEGVVMEADRHVGPLGGAAYALTLEPPVAPLGVGRNSRVFQDTTVVDIVKKVLDTAGIAADAARWSLGATYPKRAYCAQYRESDWAFVERLLAEEGIYYWFEHGEGGTVVVFGDDSTAAPEIEDGAEVPFHDDTMMSATRDSILHARKRWRLGSTGARICDYDFEKPKLALDRTAGTAERELYDWPGRFRTQAEGDRLSRVRLEEAQAHGAVLEGETSSTRIRPGLAFELSAHPLDALNGRYFVVTTRITASAMRGDARGARQGVAIAFEAVPLDTPFRAGVPRFTQAPGGPQTGAVVGPSGAEIHTESTGRVRVQHYWDREGKKDAGASTWMRVGQFALGGSMVMPRIGWDVLVHHHEGDIDQPVVVSHLYDGRYPVPYALPGNKTRTAWQTATTPGGGSTNEVRFEDAAGSEEIFINASKDMNVVIGDDKDEKVAVDYEHVIGAGHTVSVGSNARVRVGADQDVTVGASETLAVSGERTVVVAGSESATIGASRTMTAAGGAKAEANGSRSLTVGGSMMSVSAMEVSRMVLGSLSVTVGGSLVQAAAAGTAQLTLGAAAETVGGAKITAGASGCGTTVKGALAETVGGAYVIAAGGNAGESSTGSQAITVGGALLANAPKVVIEADSQITIRVGGASLTMKSGSIEVKAPSLASPGATIAKKAATIEHN